jgi:uncharacterized membrane protein
MRTSEQITEIAAALSKAQGELQNVTKDAKNPHFKSDYATLDAITDAVRPVFSKHGLAVVQIPSFHDGVVVLDILITHSSGQWISGDAGAPIAKADPQGVGSATTYLRRYSLAGIAALAQTDDDGHAASSNGQKSAQPAQAVKVPTGYESWWHDMEAVADNGTKALQEAWRKSKPEQRDFTTKIRNDRWEALKAKAAKVKEPEAVSA